jgi:hypothetical protein
VTVAEPVAVEYISLESGSFLLKYPETPSWFWNMGGYYLAINDGTVMISITNAQAQLILALR